MYIKCVYLLRGAAGAGEGNDPTEGCRQCGQSSERILGGGMDGTRAPPWNLSLSLWVAQKLNGYPAPSISSALLMKNPLDSNGMAGG